VDLIHITHSVVGIEDYATELAVEELSFYSDRGKRDLSSPKLPHLHWRLYSTHI
jgi:hypothetical protein